MTRIRWAGLAATLLAAVTFAFAAPAPAAKAQGKSATQANTEDIVFTEVEKRLIKQFFGKDRDDDDDGRKGKFKRKGGKSKQFPPGLAKRDTLPPGLAKRETLPPGLAKRDLPSDLLAQLPRRRGVGRYIVDDDVVLIEEGTNLVLDILENVLSAPPS